MFYSRLDGGEKAKDNYFCILKQIKYLAIYPEELIISNKSHILSGIYNTAK